ncbi:MAG TPA: hypothetical protein VKG92_08005 [Flavobacteriales bacterium]|nr:hypothetical protein [Flavobacteriales bacterium]
MSTKPSFWSRARTTLLAGLFVLLPLFVIVWVLKKIRSALQGPVQTLAETTGVQHVFGVFTITILTLLALVLVTYLAGLFLRAGTVGRFSGWLEENMMRYVPGYGRVRQMLKAHLGTVDDGPAPQPALFDAGNGHQPAVLLEELSGGRCVIFLPGVPDPESGGTLLTDRANVHVLKTTMAEFNACIRNFGEGLGQFSRVEELVAS